jgi:hypothetical protein
MKRFILLLAILSIPAAPAQQSAEKSSVTASLVPVGTNSDAYWEGDGPGMRAIALDPGAAPPSTLTVRTRKGFETIPTILNRPSPALPVSKGSLRVFADGKAGPEGEPKLFAEVAIPGEAGHYDVFLNRHPKSKDWDGAQLMTLPSSTSSFPEGSFRLINLCEFPVMVRLGKQTIRVSARKAQLHRPDPETAGRIITLQALHQSEGGGAELFLRTGIRADGRDRTNLIFYPGRDPKKPCKATWFIQIPPSPLEEDEGS